MTINSFKDLIAWQKAMKFCKRVYAVTGMFPSEEKFGLVSQLRRASVSVPSNIAEGWGRGKTADYLRFLAMARASLFETETQLLLAKELGMCSEESSCALLRDLDDVRRTLQGLITSLERAKRR